MGAADELVGVVDDRAGFYMVSSAAIGKCRASLSGAHLSEALAGLVCLARVSYSQHGASRGEQQCCEATLDDLASILGVSRTRALRVIDNLAGAGAVVKEAHRFDGVRRLPTKITFVDLAISFAFVSGAAFRRLSLLSDSDAPPLGALSLYVTLVALAGDQRNEFPEADRRMARASGADLARLSGLSVSSVKRGVGALKLAGLLVEHPQQANALRTAAVYRLVDPVADDDRAALVPRSGDGSQPDSRLVHSETMAGSQPDSRLVHSETVAGPQPDSRLVHSETDVGPVGDSRLVHRATDGSLSEPTRARPCDVQISENNRQTSSHLLDGASAVVGEGGEVLQADVERLVAEFLAWIGHALGQRRAEALFDDRSWRAAAAELLGCYDLERVLAGVERLSRDALLADKASTLPAFVKIADRAIARAAADQGYARHLASGSRAPASGGGDVPWATAHELLGQAVSAFGAQGEERALAFLEERSLRLAAFARHVGWRTLRRSDSPMADIKFAYIDFCRSDHTEAA